MFNNEQFDYILQKVTTRIQKDTPFESCYIIIKIFNLSFSNLESSFRVLKSSISQFLPDVLDAMYEGLYRSVTSIVMLSKILLKIKLQLQFSNLKDKNHF